MTNENEAEAKISVSSAPDHVSARRRETELTRFLAVRLSSNGPYRNAAIVGTMGRY